VFDREEFSDAPTTRAIVGYLKACPRPAGAEAIVHLKKRNPQRVAEAERQEVFGPSKQ
jgi:hypothetical protein